MSDVSTGENVSARQASQKPAPDAKKKDIQVVEFILGNEHFAIDLFDVREVVEYTNITKLPNSPPYIKGIIDLRGEITTIIDLKQRLNVIDQENIDEQNSRIIVLDDNITRSKIGIMVDDVSSVSTIDVDQVDYTSAAAHNQESSIIGIIKKKVRIKEKDSNELVIWIDIKPLIQDIHL